MLDEAYDSDAEGASIKSLQTSKGKWNSSGTRQRGRELEGARTALAKMLNDSYVPANEYMRELLESLQHIHDCVVPEKWESELDELRKQRLPILMKGESE